MAKTIKTSRFIAGDDLRIGDYITVVRATYEFVPLFCDESWRTDIDPLRVDLTPCHAGRPLKVRDICLPFVLAKKPRGGHVTLDLRRHRLVRLNRSFGKNAFKKLRKDKKV